MAETKIVGRSTVTDADASNTSATIKPGLRADLMRKVMETKNTLTTKGSIYVGTGNKEIVSVDSNEVYIYETKALSPSSGTSSFLYYDGSELSFKTPTDIFNDITLEKITVNSRDNSIGGPSGAGLVVSNYVGSNCNLELINASDSSTPAALICYNGQTSSDGNCWLVGINGTDFQWNYGITNSINKAKLDKDGNFTAVTFNATSDKRLKENIKEYICDKSILDLPIYKYDFINGEKNQIGCIAQDLQEICPEIVKENKEGYLSIQESKIVYLLLEEVKKLKKRIDELEGR